VTRSFTLTATDECTEQEAHALVAYSWTEDTTPPVITAAPTGGNLGCNPTNPPTDASVLALVSSIDDCGTATNSVSHVDATNGCTITRTFTITASDACGNVSPATTVVFTWTADTTPPVISGVPAGGSLGCNPASPPTDATVRGQVSATDGCGSPTINVSHSDTVAGCTTTRTFTITATDTCGNSAPARTAVYTWTSDTTPPTFTHLPPGGYLGTNPPIIPDDLAAQAMTQASDSCGSPSISVTHVDTGTPALYTRTFTITAADSCGNPATANAAYTWTGTNSFPLLNILSLGSNVLLYWNTSAIGFNLTARSNFTAASSWNLVTNIPAVIGDQFMVTNSATGPTRFYRLVK
jgi:hypothetical protein